MLACVALAAVVLSAGVIADAVSAEPVRADDAAAALPMRTETGNPEFDRLFALAQTELDKDRVDAITDWSFNDQKPYPCVCFETGEKWHYVWTRDLSYAADLALARLDPERTKTSLRFKLSDVRNPKVPQGLFVAQDTGSGGSWPISTDRVVWFLAARHLLDDPAFADETWRALADTLAQDRKYAFDADMGLYRGETSFLDWREQNYPAWTAKDTTFIAQSFALSTNVLHYEALRLAERMATERKDARAAEFRAQADALRTAIDAKFWREDRGLYMSYIGPAFAPVPVESYDLLGTSLAILAGIPSQERATRALADYPVVEHGSPVIWPQQPDTAIYHNRAMWPFVSAYALRAARKTADAARIEHEIRSLMRGAATAGSNMENFELTTQAVHVDDGALSGPVVNSPRQLWSVAGYLDMVLRGVFGLEDNGGVAPLLPLPLAKELFGDRREIKLVMPGRTIVLRRPKQWVGPLLGAAAVATKGETMIVSLGAGNAPSTTLRTNGAAFAPPQPAAPQWTEGKFDWTTTLPEGVRLYVDGKLRIREDDPRDVALPSSTYSQCITATAVKDGIESLPSPTTCIGTSQTLGGVFPRNWSAPHTGRYRAQFRYRNTNGPVNTGITAAVKTLVVTCGDERQAGTIVMPHREGEGDSTAFTFTARRDTPCTFTLEDATNMSDLAHFAHYTGGKGGASGPLNAADVGLLTLMPAR
ncbi:Six-hairpin glycosidase-like protein [Lysobacter sp. KIS68-7]|uniref:alpha-L-rhamnosidase-related protein n=1 Tax=Lysobacter sp. KIS68-7 TaxID=2904252 RepID=UPI001E40B76D|nr:Six-hairpin glycosidase-like protein [Lysobacter sp. KIS68-7]UHQ19315.1 Six-hairpin glycosidase-like protein [Lysobacter sp. KIS68-7]